jgi:hypothetical protein
MLGFAGLMPRAPKGLFFNTSKIAAGLPLEIRLGPQS